MTIMLKLTVAKGQTPKRGNDHYWSVIQTHAAEESAFTVSDIHRASRGAPRTGIRIFVQQLEKAGLVERAPDTEGEARYRALTRQSATPKVRADGSVIATVSMTKCMWNAMRSAAHRQGFTSSDIAAWGSTEEVKIKVRTAESYIRMLSHAGYLIQMTKARAGAPAIWRLLPDMNTGPLPPMILRTKSVFDQNRKAIIGEAVTEEERV